VLLKWDESMSTGVPKIDEQHQELLQRLNILVDAMIEGKGNQEIEDMLTFLGKYTQCHFKDEEACMEEYKCPAALINKRAHAIFIKRFQQFRDEFKQDGPNTSLLIKVQRELLQWLINHIRGIDIKMRPYAEAQK